MAHWIKSEPLPGGGIRVRFSCEVAPFWDWLREKHGSSFVPDLLRGKKNAPDEETSQWLEDARCEAHKERNALFRSLDPMPTGNRGAIELRLDEERAHGLLQCINDLRMQAWHLMGCPDEIEEPALEDANLWAYPEDLRAVRLVFEICGHLVAWITGALMAEDTGTTVS